MSYVKGGGDGIIPRRDFLRRFSSGAAGVILTERNFTDSDGLAGLLYAQHSPADEYVDSFPEKIPGVFSVEKFKNPGSSYVLIHMRQMHPVINTKQKTAKAVKEVQSGIYKTLSLLIDGNVLPRKIYAEGVDDAIQRWLDKCTDNAQNSRELRLQSLSSRPRADVTAIGEQITLKAEMEACEGSRNFFEWEYGAAGRLHMKGKAQIVPAEKYDANFKALLSMAKVKKGDPIPPEVRDDREDVLMDLVFGNKDKIALTVYGGNHDWTNNVEAWNSVHPDDKFSLIVITPEAYKRHENK